MYSVKADKSLASSFIAQQCLNFLFSFLTYSNQSSQQSDFITRSTPLINPQVHSFTQIFDPWNFASTVRLKDYLKFLLHNVCQIVLLMEYLQNYFCYSHSSTEQFLTEFLTVLNIHENLRKMTMFLLEVVLLLSYLYNYYTFFRCYLWLRDSSKAEHKTKDNCQVQSFGSTDD